MGLEPINSPLAGRVHYHSATGPLLGLKYECRPAGFEPVCDTPNFKPVLRAFYDPLDFSFKKFSGQDTPVVNSLGQKRLIISFHALFVRGMFGLMPRHHITDPHMTKGPTPLFVWIHTLFRSVRTLGIL